MNKNHILSQRQKGSVLVFFAGSVLVLIGFAVLAVDVGRLFIVRNELQNAADAAALAGANCLAMPPDASGTGCVHIESPATMYWDQARNLAIAHLSNNTADNQPVSTDSGYEVDVGYWNLSEGAPSGGNEELSRAFAVPAGEEALHRPAVRVVLTRANGQGGGPVRMLTAAMYGGSDSPVSAQAVAVISLVGGAYVPPRLAQ